MAIQTTYLENIPLSVAGALFDTGHKVLISRTVEDADGVEFGAPVVQGVNDRGCRKVVAGDTKVVGITVLDRSTNPETPDTFAQYDSARVLTEGVIAVTVSAPVVAGDVVHVDDATATFTNTGGIELVGSRYETSAAANSLAVVRLK